MDLFASVSVIENKNNVQLSTCHETKYSSNSKFLEVLLHQMPQKLQQSLAETLLPKKQQTPKNSKQHGKSGGPLFAQLNRSSLDSPIWNTEVPDQWGAEWSESCAAQAQQSLDSCWQLLKDFGLSRYVKYRYFESCYRNSKNCLERELRGELRIILQHQAEYPKTLLDLRQPPRLLFWQGQLPGPKTDATAIIGSRRADSWGLQQAWQEALLLQKQYVEAEEFVPAKEFHWIVSGLARGCDFAAHKGALEAGGRTLAVLPSGFDRIYPKNHEGLARRIADEGGALVSEYVPQAAPLKWRFIQRDRLQAALAQRLLLVQSDLSGGSMHAVQAALEIGKPIYVLNGNETCWQITLAQTQEQATKIQDFSGTLRLCSSERQFSRNKAMMNANHALLEKQLAQIWCEYMKNGESTFYYKSIG